MAKESEDCYMEKSTPGLQYVSGIYEHGFLQTENERKTKDDDGERETNLPNTQGGSWMIYGNISTIFQLKVCHMSTLKLHNENREKKIRKQIKII